MPMKPTTVHTFDLGKYFPELGPYGEWEDAKMANFKEYHHVVKIDRCPTATGGTILLVDGYKKGV